MKHLIAVLSILLISGSMYSQNPTPAKAQDKPIVIINGVIHIGNGKVINKGFVAFKDSKITNVGDAATIGTDVSNYEQIDAKGKDIYPGFIALNTTLGINEIEQARATNDYAEVGHLNPNVRSVIAYNTDSKVTPTVRSNGVLMAQIVPQGGLISGQSSVVELDAWNWEDAVYKTDDGIHLNWPNMLVNKFSPTESEDVQKDRIQKSLNALNDLFSNAKAYSLIKDPKEKNLKYESMRGLFDGSKRLYVHAGYIKELIAAINFGKDQKITIVLVGAYDAWRVTDLIKSQNISVVLGRSHSLPPREDEDVDLPYKLPFLLQQAGINYSISIDGFWQVRNLAFNAGTPVAYGLDKEQALMSITSNAAKILGIDKTVGTIEVGKDATIIISDGDALDMKSNNITTAFIRGKSINLDNIQKQLYRKYMDKYGMKE